jgi:hypothetical protein
MHKIVSSIFLQDEAALSIEQNFQPASRGLLNVNVFLTLKEVNVALYAKHCARGI